MVEEDELVRTPTQEYFLASCLYLVDTVCCRYIFNAFCFLSVPHKAAVLPLTLQVDESMFDYTMTITEKKEAIKECILDYR